MNCAVKLAMKLPDINGIASPTVDGKKRRPSVDMSDDVRAALDDDWEPPSMGTSSAAWYHEA